MLVLRKVKQLLSNFEAESLENLSNLRLAKKSVAYKKTLVYSIMPQKSPFTILKTKGGHPRPPCLAP